MVSLSIHALLFLDYDQIQTHKAASSTKLNSIELTKIKFLLKDMVMTIGVVNENIYLRTDVVQ